MSYNILYDAAMILTETTDTRKLGYELGEIRTILEDNNSPVTQKFHQKLMQSVIEKGHIDFDDIPKSAGNIRRYSGYNCMMTTLQIIKELCIENSGNKKAIMVTVHGDPVLGYVDTIIEAINNIDELHLSYENGFAKSNSYVMLEYCTYVYTCVEATTALIYQYVEFIKNPDTLTLKMTIRNSKMRADAFYFDQLQKFNKMIDTTGVNYRKMLDTLINNGKNNFFGLDDGLLVGTTAIMMVVLAIVPVTRELIYRFYHLRGKASKSLELQASFLEMNAACVEANQALTPEKKKKILEKQEKLKLKLLKLSEILRVKSVKAATSAQNELKKDNKNLTVNNLKDEISNTPLSVQFF